MSISEAEEAIQALIATATQQAVNDAKNEGFERGYKHGKWAGLMKERAKNNPDFLKDSLTQVVEALSQK